VQQGIRGVRPGSVVTIREWAGLWTGRDTHEPRYRIGERSLLFLYPPRAGGLTSPVGNRGKLGIDRVGRVALPEEWTSHNLRSQENNGDRLAAASSESNRVPVGVLAEQIRLVEVN
jgi:hypothetical protein